MTEEQIKNLKYYPNSVNNSYLDVEDTRFVEVFNPKFRADNFKKFINGQLPSFRAIKGKVTFMKYNNEKFN